MEAIVIIPSKDLMEVVIISRLRSKLSRLSFPVIIPISPSLDWVHAEINCRHFASKLVTIGSEAESNFLFLTFKEMFDVDEFWIGLSSYETFQWVKAGSNEHRQEFSHKFRPQHCVFADASKLESSSNKAWVYESCDKPKAFVCERKYSEPNLPTNYTTGPYKTQSTSTARPWTTEEPTSLEDVDCAERYKDLGADMEKAVFYQSNTDLPVCIVKPSNGVL